MRRNLLAGLCLAVAASLLLWGGEALGLKLENVVLLGAALGAVVALVPDRTPLIRVGGFAGGVVIGFLGYLMRALLLPDTPGGRAVAVFLVLLLCVGVSALAQDRLPLWSLLLGVAGLVGAYEFTYNQAPPELLTTGVDTLTSLFLSLAVGFFAASFASPTTRRPDPAPQVVEHDNPTPDAHSDSARLNDMMETSK